MGLSNKPILRPQMATAEQLKRSVDSVINELNQLVTSGLDAEKPAATGSGRFFWATDTPALYLDVDGAWVKVGP